MGRIWAGRSHTVGSFCFRTKLRVLAEKLAAALSALGGGPQPQRTQFDHLLRTIHQHPDPLTRG